MPVFTRTPKRARRGGTPALVAFTVLAVLIGGPALLVSVAAGATEVRVRIDEGPVTAVAIGDSYISGEAAGRYEAGTDGTRNYCRRSSVAEIRRAVLPEVAKVVSVACSGATTQNVRLGGSSRYGEAPQAQQLRPLANGGDVEVVVVSIGGNDFGFGDLIRACLTAYLPFTRSCQSTFGPSVDGRLATMASKVERSIDSLQQVLDEGADGDARIIVQSYPSPITDQLRAGWRRLSDGCPFDTGDLEWVRTSVVPRISRALRGVADRQGVGFLDLSRAFEGREACSKGTTDSTEWANGIDVDLDELRDGVSLRIVQQSLHPNARGHQAMADCLSALLATDRRVGTCVTGRLTPPA